MQPATCQEIHTSDSQSPTGAVQQSGLWCKGLELDALLAHIRSIWARGSESDRLGVNTALLLMLCGLRLVT